MFNPFKRKQKVYAIERDRLMLTLAGLDPTATEYHTVLTRLNELDKILNRTSELKKTVIPAAGTTAALVGIYVTQQFGGILIPKALEAHASRQEQKKNRELD